MEFKTEVFLLMLLNIFLMLLIRSGFGYVAKSSVDLLSEKAEISKHFRALKSVNVLVN